MHMKLNFNRNRNIANIQYCRFVPIPRTRIRTTRELHNGRKSNSKLGRGDAQNRKEGSQSHFGEESIKENQEPNLLSVISQMERTTSGRCQLDDCSKATKVGSRFQSITRSVFFPGSLMQEHLDLASNVMFCSHVVANPKRINISTSILFYFILCYYYLFMRIVSLFCIFNQLGIKLGIGFFPCMEIEPT